MPLLSHELREVWGKAIDVPKLECRCAVDVLPLLLLSRICQLGEAVKPLLQGPAKVLLLQAARH